MQSHIDSKVNQMPLKNPKSDTLEKCLSSSLIGAAGVLVRSSIVSCLLVAFCSVGSQAAPTSEEVIYKPNQPLKPIVEQQAAAGEPAKSEDKNYTYDPSGKTDPFKSFIAEQEEMAEKIKRKPRTYLETLDLSQLELIAIITGSQGNYAMVRDSKGVGHVIVKGTAIGTNGGVVDKITEREVTIREEFQDFKGATKFKDVSKKLPSLM
jgi:type IV pilus assembly protein PilP